MDKKNVIMVDMPVSKDWGILKGLQEETKEPWYICYKEGRLSVPRWNRIWNYIAFPLSVMFMNLKNVIAWQQFYGFMFLFYCQFFNCKKDINVFILTFIYKERKGILGAIYKQLITMVLQNYRLKEIIIYSENELSYYSNLFPKVRQKFKFLHLGISDISEGLCVDEDLQKENYLFTAGSSNRDYDFLMDIISETKYKFKIACDGLKLVKNLRVEVLYDVHDREMYQYLFNSKLVVIPLKDLEISSGQLMLLQAMQLGKPVIVSNNKGIYDYIKSGYNGFVLENNKEKWCSKIEELFSNEKLYNDIVQREIETFEKCFSVLSLGKNIGKDLKQYA